MPVLFSDYFLLNPTAALQPDFPQIGVFSFVDENWVVVGGLCFNADPNERHLRVEAQQSPTLSCTWIMVVPADQCLFDLFFLSGVSGSNLQIRLSWNPDDSLRVQFLLNVGIVTTTLEDFTVANVQENDVCNFIVTVDGTDYFLHAAGEEHTGTLPAAMTGDVYDFISYGQFPGVWEFSFIEIEGPLSEGGFPMIATRTGQWNLHRAGLAAVLQVAGEALCAGTATAVTGEYRLWTSANDPACDDAAGDYTEADFTGYAPVVVDSGDAGCTDILEIGVNEDGIGQIVFDQQAWTGDDPLTVENVVNGAYFVLIIDAVEYLLGTFLFDTPVSIGEAGDIIKVSGFALLDCEMAP